jgi:ubiquinone/menaquinone biosynthesis C-methylase UbiE
MGIDLKSPDDLMDYLNKAESIFGSISFPQQTGMSQQRESTLSDKFFHSTTGSNHALNFDGNFNPDGYLGQAKLVQEYINKIGANNVLELASGKGLNSLYLAKQNPNVTFVGIDLTPEHVKFSQERAKALFNLTFQQGNFQDLQFQAASFDIVFEVESICHSTDMEKAISEVARVLKPGGYFVVIEAFRNPRFETFSDDLKTAAKLSDVAMGIGNPWKIDEWQRLCEKVGFRVVESDDLSPAIMPNLLRLRPLAQSFFKFPKLTRMFLKTLPYSLVQSASMGSFTPFAVNAGLQRYYKIALAHR